MPLMAFRSVYNKSAETFSQFMTLLQPCFDIWILNHHMISLFLAGGPIANRVQTLSFENCLPARRYFTISLFRHLCGSLKRAVLHDKRISEFGKDEFHSTMKSSARRLRFSGSTSPNCK